MKLKVYLYDFINSKSLNINIYQFEFSMFDLT